jgi:protein-disulfide isomerase
MKSQAVILSAFLLLVAGCASSNPPNSEDVRRAIEKDPKIVFDAIEKNPEQFMDVVNRAAQVAQRKQYEAQAEKMRQDEAHDIKNPRKPEVADDRRLIGSASAPITIVEYADFQCPACGMAYKSLKQFKEKYKGRYQFVYKNMPLDFHKMAYPSATYFEAIRLQGKDKALRFYELAFENQRDLDNDFLKRTAKQVGADMARLEKDIQSNKVKDVIAADQAEFEKFGFTGTPVLIVNGVAMQGAQPLSEIERVISETKRN